MDSMIVEVGARLSTYEDFKIGTNAASYSKQLATWRFYEAEYRTLTNNGLEGTLNGPN